MLARKPPLAIVAPGVVYRRDDDATHSPIQPTRGLGGGREHFVRRPKGV